jgi:hypothetical protein
MAALMLVVSLAVVLLYGTLLRRQFDGWQMSELASESMSQRATPAEPRGTVAGGVGKHSEAER